MDEEIWADIRTRCSELESGAVLETPVSERRFEVVRTDADRIVVRFRDSDEERPLWREQFAVFVDGLDAGQIAIDELQPGVEPYAVVLTLADEFTVVNDLIARDPDAAAAGESPYLVSPAAARTRSERVHDDALLLATLLERIDADDPAALETDGLTDYYVLASDVQRGADRLRQSAREPLLDRLGPEQELHGRYGTVRRTTRKRRNPKDDETVFDALEERGIPREWVLGVDAEKLDVVLSVTDLSEDDVYDIEEDVYVQKTGVDEDEKYSRLQGIADRLDELGESEREELRTELDDIEARLEEALSVG